MMHAEEALIFTCGTDRLIGILHAGAHDATSGIMIVVGGPQYRVGSHRQFVLMARRLAAAGTPVFRFDVRGMGDSDGDTRPFDSLCEDIRTAIDHFTVRLPNLKKVLLLGLCDGASASLIYAHTDPRVHGLVLLNPWVRTHESEAKVQLRYYYLSRVAQKSFWRKVVSGEFMALRSLRDLLRSLLHAHNPGIKFASSGESPVSFIDRMYLGLVKIERPILLMISGRDLTAKEFMRLIQRDAKWRISIKRSGAVFREFPRADHTMSERAVLDAASDSILEWLGRAM